MAQWRPARQQGAKRLPERKTMDFSNLTGGRPSRPAASQGLTLDLNKGVTLDLVKEAGGNLHQVDVGLAWDPAVSGKDVDLDLSAFFLHHGRVQSLDDILYYKADPSMRCFQYAQYSGDSRDGSEADGDDPDEFIKVDLDRIPADIDSIVFVVTIYDAVRNNQTFGVVRSLVKIEDGMRGKNLATYRLNTDNSVDTAFIIGELVRTRGGWSFKGIADGRDGDLNDLLRLYS